MHEVVFLGVKLCQRWQTQKPEALLTDGLVSAYKVVSVLPTSIPQEAKEEISGLYPVMFQHLRGITEWFQFLSFLFPLEEIFSFT